METKKMWLVQRGKIRNIKDHDTLSRMILFDYMGSAEFEFGALSKSLSVMEENRKSYSLFITDMITLDDPKMPLNIFCMDNEYKEVRSIIVNYIQKQYQLKEWIGLTNHFYGNKYDSCNYRKFLNQYDFWWCIDGSSSLRTDIHPHDFMFFLGNEYRQKRILSGIYNEFDNFKTSKMLLIQSI